MLAVVKKPHIEIRGDLPELFLEMTRKFFGERMVSIIDESEELLTPETSEWFQNTAVLPGEAMRSYREIHELTQEAIGQKLGGVARSEVSKMENGKRNISIKTARKLAEIFDVSVDRFI